MDGNAIGLLEVVGRVASIEAADAGMKAANVQLLGSENATGALITVKFCGDVGAVKAAIEAAKARVIQIGGTIVATLVLPRPALGIAPMLSCGVQGTDSSSEDAVADSNQITEEPVITQGNESVIEAGRESAIAMIQETATETAIETDSEIAIETVPETAPETATETVSEISPEVFSKRAETAERETAEQPISVTEPEVSKKNSSRRKNTKATGA
ncbi:MAG: BMC domain-containing protein [Sporomusaceae bacterium]|nr:BMC domain-containing protein [Sporomusaceae bacterium]